KLLKSNPGWIAWVKGSRAGYLTDLALDWSLFPSPYAAAFGVFINCGVAAWFASGSLIGSAWQTASSRAPRKPEHEGLPEDMSAVSLVGGGLIAGDALAALAIGLFGLLKTVL